MKKKLGDRFLADFPDILQPQFENGPIANGQILEGGS
jgi:hypothetical protein